MLSFQEVGEPERMPVITFGKDESISDTVSNILTLYSDEVSKGRWTGRELKDNEAEYVFHSMVHTKLIEGVQFTFKNGSGSMRFEIWDVQDFIFVYQTSNRGYRQLKMIDKSQLQIAVKEIPDVIKLYGDAITKIRHYRTLKERDSILQK